MSPTPGGSPASQTMRLQTTASPASIEHAPSSASPGPTRNTRRKATRTSGRSSTVISRQPHVKSRTGCKTCKRRRIKCDEHRPSCRNCEKHAVTCDFVQQQVPFASSTSPRSTRLGPHAVAGTGIASSFLPQISSSLPCTPGHINMMDLELMHNFTTCTYTTLASDPAVRQLLRTTAAHMAVGCEYIMRSMLAVSALHLSRYRPHKKHQYISRAMQHHQAATAAAIEHMSDLRTEECERLHIFSVLTVYYALGCPAEDRNQDLDAQNGVVPHWLRLLHGMEPIIHALNPENYHGVLTPLFEFGRRRMRPFLKSTPPRDPSLMKDLQSRVHQTCADVHLLPTYDDMFEQLRRILGLILAIKPIANGNEAANSPAEEAEGALAVLTNIEAWDILVWQWTQSKEFLPLLETPQPPQEALVIFAHCLLVLRKSENQWWLEGWADHLMGKTWDALDEEHRHWVGWVTEEMGWIPPR